MHSLSNDQKQRASKGGPPSGDDGLTDDFPRIVRISHPSTPSSSPQYSKASSVESLSSIRLGQYALLLILAFLCLFNGVLSHYSMIDRPNHPSPEQALSLAEQDSLGFFQGISNHAWLHRRSIAQSRQTYKDPTNPALDMARPHVWYQNNWEPDLTCAGEDMIGNMGDGHKWICDPYRIEEQSRERMAKNEQPCLVYSIGSHGAFDFEEAVKKKMPSCEVHTFDFKDHRPEIPPGLDIEFHTWGLKPSYETPDSALGSNRHFLTMKADLMKEDGPYKTLQETVRELGHENRTIDIFKIDCEGCELLSYKDWVKSSMRQVVVEVHYTPPVVLDFFQAFRNANFAIFHKEPNILGCRGTCIEYSFIRMAPSFYDATISLMYDERHNSKTLPQSQTGSDASKSAIGISSSLRPNQEQSPSLQPPMTTEATATATATPTTTAVTEGSVQSKEPKLIQLNQSPNLQPTIYFCQDDGNGLGEAKSIFKSVFPEYRYQDMSEVGTGKHRRAGQDANIWQHRIGNPYDMFLITTHAYCSGVVMKWLFVQFAGKMVRVSGESDDASVLGQNRPDKFHYILGPVEDEGPQQMPLTYLQMTWWAVFRASSSKNGGQSPDAILTDVTQKPKNDGKHFLIYAASRCVDFRERAFDDLSSIGLVHYGGRCKGYVSNDHNKTKYANSVTLRNWQENVQTYHSFRFCLVMEHKNQLGYTTEKILMAFLGGCIPIYYGSSQIFEIFNRAAFVFYDVSDPKAAQQRIAYLEQNKAAYTQTLNEAPILAQGAFEKYFSFDDNVGGGQLKQRIRQKLGVDQYQFVNS